MVINPRTIVFLYPIQSTLRPPGYENTKYDEKKANCTSNRLHIAQLENTLEMRDDDVVQTCEKSHHKEQDHGHRHRSAIRYRVQLALCSGLRYLLRVQCQASSFPKATQIRQPTN